MAANNFGTSLVIGGTGMLASATCWLAARSERTIVVARHASNFASGNQRSLAVDADWADPSFPVLVGQAIEQTGPIEKALLWLHDPVAIIPRILPLIENAQTVLVLGSRQRQPEILAGKAHITIVRLGSIQTDSGRRWLTHDEISNGAIAALQDKQSRIIGDHVPQ
ncbi:hypothetical protein V1525DRAFT_410238 [Lipomyces kononenkoae]|uniref:Uncharacterized protein n=1 Tax=Lipomyces kononenkoae TaxID=34357 RepID=A0ACC3SUR2_LIPKO